jgi:hypothetical protein
VSRRRSHTKVLRPTGLVKLADPSADLERKRQESLDEYIDKLLAEQESMMFWCYDLPHELLKEIEK